MCDLLYGLQKYEKIINLTTQPVIFISRGGHRGRPCTNALTIQPCLQQLRQDAGLVSYRHTGSLEGFDLAFCRA